MKATRSTKQLLKFEISELIYRECFTKEDLLKILEFVNKVAQTKEQHNIIKKDSHELHTR